MFIQAYICTPFTYIRCSLQRHGLALYPGLVHSGIIRASIAGGFWVPVMRVGLPICAGFNFLATQPTHMALAAGAPAFKVKLRTQGHVIGQHAPRHNDCMRQTTMSRVAKQECTNRAEDVLKVARTHNTVTTAGAGKATQRAVCETSTGHVRVAW